MQRKVRDDVAAVERAMVAIRRRQSRRTLASLAAGQGAAADAALAALLDAVEGEQESGRPSTVTSLTAVLGVDQPRASKLVARATDQGLLRREADPRDGRRCLLVLTTAGHALLESVHRFRRGVFERAMADWPDRDRADFARLLTRFVGALTQDPAR